MYYAWIFVELDSNTLQWLDISNKINFDSRSKHKKFFIINLKRYYFCPPIIKVWIKKTKTPCPWVEQW